MALNEFELTLDGKPEKFKLTIGEVEEIEDAFNLPIEEINLGRMKAMRLLVEFVLRRRNPGVNPMLLRQQVQVQDLDEFQARLAQPEDEPAEKPAPPTRAKAKPQQ